MPVATGFSPITIDESFADWKAVNTTYRDDAGDITPRDHHGWGRFARYENNSGRHGLTLAKVACDAAIPQTVAA